jgi:Zn-dependent oligopeptidase
MRRLPPLAALIAALALPSFAAASPAPPLDWSMDAATIARTCAAEISATDGRVQEIARPRRSGAAFTFRNTVLPLEDATADESDALAAQIFLSSVAPSKAARDASLACDTKLENAFSALAALPGLYAAVEFAAASGTAKTVYDKKLTDLWLETLHRSGAQLSATRRAEFVKRESTLHDLENRFGQNLANDATTIEIPSRQSNGISSDMLAGFSRTNDGGYTVEVNSGTYEFLSQSTNEDARRAYYIAFNNRAAAANVPLLEQAIAVRDRLAHLLGYETWADYRLADRMAGTPARVAKFIGSTTTALTPAVAAQIDAMQNAIRAENRDARAVLQPWDVKRGEYLVSKAHAVDGNAIRQYFPVQHTIDAVLDVYHALLGVTFAKVVPADAWAPGVLEYRVLDTVSGKLLGITYFDLYPRPGKYDYFANFPILLVRATPSGRVPVAAIVGNWPKPSAGSPALLSHADVVTFFHEFGHDLAALLATAPYETLTDGFRTDFVEAPSQMLENFAWQPEILRRITSNWKTGEPMPDSLIAQLVASRETTHAYEIDRLLVYGKIDLEYHSMGPHVDTTAVWAKTAAQMLPLLYYPGTHPQVAFGHMMGGYDAGLYAYPWALVYAQDMFTAFSGGNSLDPAVGMRYRTTILAPARTYEPDEEVQAFLGRPSRPDAFYAEFSVTP